MAKVRGTAVLGTLDYARARYGAAAAERLFAALPQAMQATLVDSAARGVAAHGWYDTELVVELTRRIDSEHGKGDLLLAREIGTHVAFQDVNRFFKWLMRLGGPSVLFQRAGAVWNNYYDDGRYVLEQFSAGRVVMRIESSSSAGNVVCRRIEGWIERALDLTLGPEAHPQIREQDHLVSEADVGSQPFCRFVAEWRA